MTHDAHNRDNYYPHTEIEGAMEPDSHAIDRDLDARLNRLCNADPLAAAVRAIKAGQAARAVGDALGLDSPKAEARIAADLAVRNPCPKCGREMHYEPASWNPVDGGYRPEVFPASLSCAECDYWEDATPVEDDNPND